MREQQENRDVHVPPPVQLLSPTKIPGAALLCCCGQWPHRIGGRDSFSLGFLCWCAKRDHLLGCTPPPAGLRVWAGVEVAWGMAEGWQALPPSKEKQCSGCKLLSCWALGKKSQQLCSCFAWHLRAQQRCQHPRKMHFEIFHSLLIVARAFSSISPPRIRARRLKTYYTVCYFSETFFMKP